MLLAVCAQRIILQNSGAVDTELPQKVSKHNLAYYYIWNEKMYSISQMSDMFSVPANTILPVTDTLFTAPLEHKIALKYSKSGEFWIRKIPSAHKLGTGNSTLYLALCPANCDLPGEVISRSEFSAIFRYSGNVAKIPCVRKVSAISSEPSFHTRYSKAMTFNNHNDFRIGNKTYTPHIEFYEHGYYGMFEMIAIADTGLDVDNPFFSSIAHRSLNLSKVHEYWPIADNLESDDGHGTFVAGVAAGHNTCSESASMYDGIAPSARIMFMDIHDKATNSYRWPANFTDLFDVASKMGSGVFLNTWTTNDKLMSHVIDLLAWQYPNMTVVFAAERDNVTGRVLAPADSKNVLTVGATYGHTAVRTLIEGGGPVTVMHLTMNTLVYGYCDPMGLPLINSSLDNYQDMVNMTIGTNPGQIGVVIGEDEDIEALKDCQLVLVFHTEPIREKIGVTVIRMPPDRAGLFYPGAKISIYLADHFVDGITGPYMTNKRSGYGTDHVFRIKPDIVVPGGPMLGPAVGARGCNLSSMTVKEGPSVAAAVAAGNCALLREFFRVKHKITAGSELIRAGMIHFSSDFMSAQRPSIPRGWGTPQIDHFLSSSIQTIIVRNSTKSNSHQSYVVKTTRDSTVRVTLSWMDYPRDPESIIQISQPLYMTISTAKHGENHIIANMNNQENQGFDTFNTIQHVEIVVPKNDIVVIHVFSMPFQVFDTVNYTLLVSGKIDYVDAYVSTPKSLTCPRMCEGGRKSSCVNGRCVCDKNRGGDFCSEKIEKATLGQAHIGEKLPLRAWRFFRVFPDEGWTNGSKLIINTEKLDLARYKMLVNVGKPPTWNDWLCTRTHCPWGTVKNKTLTLKYEDWSFVTKSNPFMIGLVQTSHIPTDYEIAFYHDR